MNYYSLEFLYKGIYDDLCKDPQADKDLAKADNFVSDAFIKEGLEFAHEYSWPDGSLLKYVRSDLTCVALRDKVDRAVLKLSKNTVRVHDIHAVVSNQDPYKRDFKTLEEYMDWVKANPEWR